MMDRRTFAKQVPAAVAGACGLSRAVFGKSILGDSVLSDSARAQPNKSDNKAASTTAIKLSVMLWTVFTDLPFERRLEKIAEAGYRHVELVGEYEKWTEADFIRTNTKRKELGITFDATAGLKHSLSDPADREPLLADLRNALVVMEKLSCPSMIVLSGNRMPGLPREAQYQSCIDGLKAMAAVVEGKSIDGEPVRLFLETIDPEENPQYFLPEITDALEVVQSVAHSQVQLLYDFYHQQIAGGNLIAKLEKCIPHLGLVHIADVPGRHEPSTGEINYQNIFRKLGELNYKGVAAMEFHPSGDPVEQLRQAREMAMETYSSHKHRA